jgi:sirohydrochlorin cobaltochelatase
VLIGKPLLYQHEDIDSAVAAITKILPQNLKKGEAVLTMGHGTHHPSNIYYAGIQYYLRQRNPLFFLATVERYPGLEEILPKLAEQKIKTVWLMPFMSVVGDHA